MTILIIEDEAKTGRELRQMIQRLDDRMEVLDIIPSVKAARTWFSEHAAPRLIISDIQLADGLSFEIFQSVPVHCPVIFCTAYDSYAMEAFSAHGIDYLLKPVDEEKLSASLQKYGRLQQWMKPGPPSDFSALSTALSAQKSAAKSSLLVYANEKIIPLKTADISFIHSAGGIVKAYTSSKTCFHLSEVLDDLEQQLDPRQFFRANRQYLVNRDAIVMAEHYFNRRLVLKLNMTVPEPVIISKMKTPDLMTWLQR